jgi:hypothetical protein
MKTDIEIMKNDGIVKAITEIKKICEKNDINDIVVRAVEDILFDAEYLSELFSSKKAGNYIGGLPVNTYPFDDSLTDEIYPWLLAVCGEKGNLSETLDYIVRHCYRNSGNDLQNTVEGVLLLSTKWDGETFNKYEKDFVNQYKRIGIIFIPVLVTEYGVTEIPLFR